MLTWLTNIDWTWPALMLAFLCGVQLTRWVIAKRLQGADRAINEDYFRGLNYLLNEQPDKAIEVFIKALEVDSDTVELHLALGGLFRRKGQIDRATRIHQNLIARPDLSDQHRLQAIQELAQDYDHAGLLDRAENLYLELLDTTAHRKQALEGLEKLYQHEREWCKAIDVVLQHRSQDKPELEQALAHYWCELADEAIQSTQLTEAAKCLRNAHSANPDSVRALQLKGDLAFAKQEYQAAITHWQRLALESPSLVDLVVEKCAECFVALNDLQGLTDFFLKLSLLPKSHSALDIWFDALAQGLGRSKAIEYLVERLNVNGANQACADKLLALQDAGDLPSELKQATLRALLTDSRLDALQYTCGVCGFGVKSIHWQCPNCGRWESFS